MSCQRLQITIFLVLITAKFSCKSVDQEQRLAARQVPLSWAISGYLPENPEQKIWVVIRGDRIQAVLKKEPDFPTIDTEGFIFPGLIDLQGELASQNLQKYLSQSSDLSADQVCALLRWSEIKALSAGVTATILGDQRWASCVSSYAVRDLDVAGEFADQPPLQFLGDFLSADTSNVFDNYFVKPMRSQTRNYQEVFADFEIDQGLRRWLDAFHALPNNLENGLALLLGRRNLPSWATRLPSTEALLLQDPELSDILAERLGVRDSHMTQVLQDMREWLDAYRNLLPEQISDEQIAWNFLANPAVLGFSTEIKDYILKVELAVRQRILNNESAGAKKATALRLDRAKKKLPGEYYKYLQEAGIEQPGLIIQNAIGLSSREMKAAGAKHMTLVWTPYFDKKTYGKTLDIVAARQAAVNLVLGSDGQNPKHLLDQMQSARTVLDQVAFGQVTDRDIVEMATVNAARALGLDDQIAHIDKGYLADFLIIDRCAENPYRCLLRSDQQNIKLVVVGGEGLFGDHSIISEGQGLWQRPGSYEVLPSRRGATCLKRDKALWLDSHVSAYDLELSLDSSRPFLRDYHVLEDTVLMIRDADLIFTCDDEAYLQEFRGNKN